MFADDKPMEKIQSEEDEQVLAGIF